MPQSHAQEILNQAFQKEGKLYKNKDDWSADELITKVDPDWIVVSVGKNNSHGHPSKEFNQVKSRYPAIQFLGSVKKDLLQQTLPRFRPIFLS